MLRIVNPARFKTPEGIVAVDTETTGLNPWTGDRPFAVSICNAESEYLYFDWVVDPFTRQPRIHPDDKKLLRKYISDPNLKKVFHNAKFDVRMLEMIDVPFAGRVEDTMLAMRCAKSDLFNFKLKPLCAQYCDIPADDEKELQKVTCKARRMAKKLGWKLHDEVAADYWVPRTLALLHPDLFDDQEEWKLFKGICERYCSTDTERALALWTLEDGHVLDAERVRHVYEKEMKLFWVVYHMEERGFNLLPKRLDETIKAQTENLKELAKELKKWNPKGYNLNSPVQLRKLLWEDLKIDPPNVENVPYGSTSMKVLEKVNHPIVMTLLRYRGTEKLLSTFLLKYRSLARPDKQGNLIIHPDFSQYGAATSRFSCHNPNIQNVPEPTKTRSIIRISSREVFGPRPGHLWYHYDYSGLEVRIFAGDAKEETLLQNLKDPHTACANKAWGGENNEAGIRLIERLLRSIKPEQYKQVVEITGLGPKTKVSTVPYETLLATAFLEKFDWDIVKAEGSIGTKNARAIAKMLLFLKLYGGGPSSAAALMNVSKDEAKSFLASYDYAMPGIPRYINDQIRLARKLGEVRTLYDYRIPVDLNFAYKAVNYRIQGSAAGLLKDRMLACEEYCLYLRSRGLEWYVIGSIHDEIVFECRREHSFPWIVRRIKTIMEDVRDVFTNVHLEVECSVTRNNWLQPEKVQL